MARSGTKVDGCRTCREQKVENRGDVGREGFGRREEFGRWVGPQSQSEVL